MYFDPEPKEKKDDLYNSEKEYKEMHESIKNKDRIIVIKGIRRIGKTSLMKVVFNELKCPRAFIDGRVVPPKQEEILSRILQESIASITERFVDLKLREFVKEIAINPFGIGAAISFSSGIKGFETVDEILKKRKTSLVVFIDEAQRLKAGNISGIIAHLFEHTRNIIMVVAGSEVGLLEAIMGEDAESDLYGRPKKIIEMGRLKKEQALEFMQMGFKQHKKIFSENDAEKVEAVFDGIVGWLALFGYYSKTHGIDDAIEMVRKEAGKITAKEIEHFLQFRKEARGRYLKLLEVLSVPLRWVEVKRFLEAQTGKKVNDKTASKYINELEEYGLIAVNAERRYVLADPMIKEGVLILTRGK
jgi:AAA+ ATPase superfamily predicted ATPase